MPTLSRTLQITRSKCGFVSATTPLLFADVLVPDFGMRADVAGEQRRAFLGIEIDHAHADRAQPVEAALKIPAFADHQRAEAELPDESAAIPARRESRDHDQIAIGATATGVAERVGLAVHRSVA